MRLDSMDASPNLADSDDKCAWFDDMRPRSGAKDVHQTRGNGGGIVNVSSGAAKYGSARRICGLRGEQRSDRHVYCWIGEGSCEERNRVNAVRPGHIYTELHSKGGEPQRVDRMRALVPMHRGGQPEEVAHAILWLLSPEASYIAGTIVDVSGGR